jgi:hypothetical protein
MKAFDCAASCGNPPPTPVEDATPWFLYFLDSSQKPPRVHDILICHSSNDECRPNLHLALSAIFQGAMNNAITLGFAETVIDLKVILDFMEKFYGKPSGWSSKAADANEVLRKHRLAQLPCKPQTPSPLAPSPNPQALLQSLNTLATISPDDFNPALLPVNIPGYVKAIIGRHQPQSYTPQTVFTTLSYDEYEIPESAVHGMIQYGQEFIKVLSALSTLTNSNVTWSKNNPNSSWLPEQISNFLYITLQTKNSSNLSILLKRLSNNRNRVTFAGKRGPITKQNVANLQSYIASVL